MELKSKTNLFIAFGAIVLVAASFASFAVKLYPKDSSAYAVPAISYLETDGAKVIVHAKSGENSERFVYCLSSTNDSTACTWDNSDEFELGQEGDYYFFIKSLTSGKISEPKLKTYQIVDYSNFKL